MNGNSGPWKELQDESRLEKEAEILDTMLYWYGSARPPYNWTGSFQAIMKLKSKESREIGCQCLRATYGGMK
jgi:hypothetical protein